MRPQGPFARAENSLTGYRHGHVDLIGDDDDDDASDPMQWSPENDPDQFAYNAEPDPNADDESDDNGDPEGDPDADETEDAPAPTVRDAIDRVVTEVGKRFSGVSHGAVPQSLKRKRVCLAVFVTEDGRVKVLRA